MIRLDEVGKSVRLCFYTSVVTYRHYTIYINGTKYAVKPLLRIMYRYDSFVDVADTYDRY